MSQEKIKIPSTHEGHPSGQPLMPVVEFWLAQGGKIANGQSMQNAFATDAAGTTRCFLIGETLFQDVIKAFSFPKHCFVGSESDRYISDEKHRSIIIFTTFEEHEKRVTDRTAKKTARLERAAIARKKLKLKNGG